MTELRDRMVEITAQGQTVQVGQPAQVRDWLDLYGGSAHGQQREFVASACSLPTGKDYLRNGVNPSASAYSNSTY